MELLGDDLVSWDLVTLLHRGPLLRPDPQQEPDRDNGGIGAERRIAGIDKPVGYGVPVAVDAQPHLQILDAGNDFLVGDESTGRQRLSPQRRDRAER